MFTSHHSVSARNELSPGALSRRAMLKAMASGGMLAAGGGLLSACQKKSAAGPGASEGKTVDVTLTTHDGWPFGVIPTSKDQKADPGKKAYAGVLEQWMRKNPGVKIKNATLNVWDQRTLTTAITGGTAPSMYPGDVIGGWNRSKVRSAMLQGLSADVTEYVRAYHVREKLESFVTPIWDKWEVNGKFYAAPWIYNVGTGLHYRRDLVEQLGLKEPTPDWTWDDVRTLAKGLTKGKRKGIALQGWGLNMGLNANGMDFQSTVPDPSSSWNWRWDYSAGAKQWIPLIQRMRAMIYEDKSVLADVSMVDGDTLAAFSRGDVGMHNNTVIYFTVTPGGDNAPADLAKKLDKPIEDVVGWMTQPVGTNGRNANTQGQCDLVGFSPDLEDDAIDKAMSLLTFSQQTGWIEQRKAVYDATKDPKRVYDWANIMPLYKGLLDKVPSSPDEAWGKTYMNEVRRAAAIPISPNDAFYFPPEANSAPTTTIRDDMTSRWTNERGNLNFVADLTKLDTTLDKQSKSFTSSVKDADFIKAASAYFEAHDRYWKANAPDYYQNVFKGWYESTVLPALKG